MRFLLGLFFSVLIMANSEPFSSDLFGSDTEILADPGDTIDYGPEAWGNAEDPFTSDVQPVTSLDFAFHSSDPPVDPTPSKVEFCALTILATKPYCCDGVFLPDGVMTDCIECMTLMRITRDTSNNRRRST
jgi:hypothetical protein